MNLGLIDGHFVPHNLISTQENPVPLPQFRMAPRLKILMSSGSKKGTKIHFPFLSKSPGKRIHSRFLNGAPMERDTRLQGIFTYLLIYLFISKALRKERHSMFPKSGAPMETLPAGKSHQISPKSNNINGKYGGKKNHVRVQGFHCTSVYTAH
jgi:hypothetical protein